MRYRWIYWTSFVLGLEVFLSKHLSPDLNKCSSSIQSFLASSTILTLIQIVLVGLSLLLNFRTNTHNKFIDFLFFIVLPLYPIYVVVAGIMAVVQSSEYSPACFKNTAIVIYAWVGAYTLNELFLMLVLLKTVYQKVRPPAAKKN